MTLAVSVDPETRMQPVNVPSEVVALLCSRNTLRPRGMRIPPSPACTQNHATVENASGRLNSCACTGCVPLTSPITVLPTGRSPQRPLAFLCRGQTHLCFCFWGFVRFWSGNGFSSLILEGGCHQIQSYFPSMC